MFSPSATRVPGLLMRALVCWDEADSSDLYILLVCWDEADSSGLYILTSKKYEVETKTC
jgi:hypothetical protein